MKMLERFLQYIRDNDLCREDERVLLAVSGGMDSMLMASLFSESHFSFGIAHCNFGLRGEESDQDEEFVKRYAEKLGVPFYTTRFNTNVFARREKISTQMAARQLRYGWFDTIAAANGYLRIAVAHHLSDLVETMLINLVRGTGLAGLHGILPKKGAVIRPLLGFTREEIAAAVSAQKLPYREESTNASDKYQRNRLRHQVVPVLKALNPRLEHTFAETAAHFFEAEQFIEQHLGAYRQLLIKDGESWRLSCKGIAETGSAETVLFHLLKPFGFKAAVSREILSACNSQPGKQFFSSTHRIIKDRDHLIIVPAGGPPQENTPGQAHAAFEELFETEIRDAGKTTIIPEDNTAFLDYAKLEFPLSVRYWREGDRFHPLGMRGRKKLSDFFVDLKIPLHLKQRIPLVISGGEIAWVAGYRIADPFKVTAATKKVCRIKSNFPKIN